jgi:Zinc knuckle.
MKKADPTKYALEDVSTLADELKPVAETLLSATKFEPSLTAQMLHSIYTKITPTHQFNYDMNGIIAEVKAKLRQVSFLDNISTNRAMEEADLDPCTVLDRVADLRTEVLLDGNWEPVTRKVDSGHVIACTAEVAKAIDLSVQQALIALVVQKTGKKGSSGKSSSSEVTCHKCGEVGHIKPNCPKLKGKKKSGGVGSSKTDGGTKNSWHHTAPNEGDPHTKKVNGKDHFWCQKCQRWNTSHLTRQHKKKGSDTSDYSPPSNPALAAALGMFQDDVVEICCSLVESVELAGLGGGVSVLPVLLLILGFSALVL